MRARRDVGAAVALAMVAGSLGSIASAVSAETRTPTVTDSRSGASSPAPGSPDISGGLESNAQIRAGSTAGTVNPNKTITFMWGLARRDARAVKVLGRVSKPNAGRYRQFSTNSEVSRHFGASPRTINRVRNFLKSKRLRGEMDASNLFMRVTGRAGTFQRAFNTPIEVWTAPGVAYYAPTEDPVLPPRIARLVPDPIWSSTVQTRSKATSDGSQSSAIPPVPVNEGTVIGGCPQLASDSWYPLEMTAAQEAVAYGLAPLQIGKSKRPRGSQPLMGILAWGSGYSNSLLRLAKSCFGSSARPFRIETGGLRTALPSTAGEGDLDVQVAVATLVGKTRIPVFEGIGTEDGSLGSLAESLNSRWRPTVLSVSYSWCEPEIEPATRRLMDSILVRLGLLGTGVLAAAGDSGSSGCRNQDTGQGPTAAAVAYPASSPWATAVGGTRIVLNTDNRRVEEVVWNDSAWGLEVAGGGGVSVLYDRPEWQPFGATGQEMRAVPDLASHASELPGFPLIGAGGSGFAQPVGGTSAAAPFTASGIALMNLKLRSRQQPPLGFLNPWLYRLPTGTLFDITEGNNDLFGTGCCTAGVGYDRASGIGSPNFAPMLANVRRVKRNS